MFLRSKFVFMLGNKVRSKEKGVFRLDSWHGTQTSRDLAARIFPRLRQFACCNFEFSLASCGIFLAISPENLRHFRNQTDANF